MDKEKGIAIAVEREEGEISDTLVVSSATVRDDIINFLDHYSWMNDFESRIVILTIMLRIVQISNPNLDDIKARSKKDFYLRCVNYKKYAEHVILRLLDYVTSCVCLEHHSKWSATMSEDELVELLDSIVMKLHILSQVKSIFPFASQYETLQNVCCLIRDLHALKVNGCIEPDIVEFVIPQVQLMDERVAHFCFVLLANELIKFVDRSDKKLDFPRGNPAQTLEKIIPIGVEVMHISFVNLQASNEPRVEHFVKQLIKVSPDILFHLRYHMVNATSSRILAPTIIFVIEFLLVILTDMSEDFIHHEKLFDLLAHVGAITKELSALVCNFRNKSSEEATNDTNCAVLKNIELLKIHLKLVYLKVPEQLDLDFHMSDGSLFLTLLLTDLNGLLNSNACLVALIKEEIGLIKEDLEFMRSFFGNVEQILNKDLWKRVLDVAYEAKYVINSILARDEGLLHFLFSLPNAVEKIKLIREEVSNFPKRIPSSRFLIIKSPKNSVDNKSLTGKIIVGFEEETDSIIRLLTSGPKELDVISIVGMPGSGKTTLAFKVYNDRSVISHFDIRAWCTVDQEYDRKMILHKLLNQATGSNEKFREDIDVDDVLRRKLYGRRCLIILDDLWDNAAWEDLTRPFHQVGEGSRIILTSRKKDVALQAKRHSDPLEIRPLTQEESWELLEKRVFREESCPIELLDVGKEIAQKCKGLPLVVDLIAGVTAKMEKEEALWLEILEGLDSFISEEEQAMKVIQLSYDQLTDHIKLCFLYLGSYKKDEQIRVKELSALWSAEGFLEENEMKSVEEVVEDYLDYLVSSSLVSIGSEGEYNREKVVQIHDLIHDFCLMKAKKEKLFEWIRNSSASYFSSSPELMPRQLNFYFEDYRPESYISFSLFDSEKKGNSSHKHLLSLKITGNRNARPSLSLSLSLNPRLFRLLRVLRIGNKLIEGYLVNEIAMLVHLRYLNIETLGMESLPLSFSNLLNIETLVVDNSGGIPMDLEPVIWNLEKLRYLEITPCCLDELRTDEQSLLAEDSKLVNLRILKLLLISPMDISKRFPNLQKLDCVVEESCDSSAGCNWFPQFGFLSKLEELSVIVRLRDQNLSFEMKHQSDFSFFPLRLRSLKFIFGFVTCASLSTIARLPNLEELELSGLRIKGGIWNMRDDDTFKNLKLLHMVDMSISEWQVGEELFPMLEHLIFEFCEELKEIPPSFGDIDSLKCIELRDCCRQLEESAQKIKEYVGEMTGDDDKLQVLIVHLKR